MAMNNSKTALLEALNNNANKIAQEIIVREPTLAIIPLDDDNNTLLHLAAQNGNIELLNFILSGNLQLPNDLALNINVQSKYTSSFH
jgi:ankyrin repeat protein